MICLRVDNLAKSYDGFVAVRDVSFAVAEGERVALIGPNGAGKSTCFQMISGQIKPSRGTIRILGHRTDGFSPQAIACLGVGRTFQTAAVFSSMTLVENVQTALLAKHGVYGPHFRKALQWEREEALVLLDAVGLRDQADKLSTDIAYGDVKRLDLALALAGNPRLLLMDEPVAGVSAEERRPLMDLVTRLVRERSMSVLFTEHDIDIVFDYADRILILDNGTLIAQGLSADVAGVGDILMMR